jgi:hypothetical protein
MSAFADGKSKGYTLVELMLASGLMAALALSVRYTVEQPARLHKATAANAMMRQMTHAADLLVLDLQEADPANLRVWASSITLTKSRYAIHDPANPTPSEPTSVVALEYHYVSTGAYLMRLEDGQSRPVLHQMMTPTAMAPLLRVDTANPGIHLLTLSCRLPQDGKVYKVTRRVALRI